MDAQKQQCGMVGCLYGKLVKIGNGGRSGFLLAIRLYIGYRCALSGYGHLTNFQTSVEAFKGYHVPMPVINVAISGTTELVGGTLLLVGLASRLISILLIGNFIVAILASNLSDPQYREPLLHFWNNQNVILNDTAFPFLMTAIIVFFFGPGCYSIDGYLKHRMKKHEKSQGVSV